MSRILFAEKHIYMDKCIIQPIFLRSYLQVMWWALGKWKGRQKFIEWSLKFSHQIGNLYISCGIELYSLNCTEFFVHTVWVTLVGLFKIIFWSVEQTYLILACLLCCSRLMSGFFVFLACFLLRDTCIFSSGCRIY